MASPIEFWFDYSSPFGYIASERIESIAAKHGRDVAWHPILLGAIFKVTGGAPLTEAPMKGEYSLMDMRRSAREHDIPFRMPEKFPIGAVAASRATLWLQHHEDDRHAALATALIHALFRAYYAEGHDISDAATVLDIAAGIGVDRAELEAALGDPAVKDALRAAVERAIGRKVFGSPTFAADGEMFWGSDRLEMLDRWLASGGW